VSTANRADNAVRLSGRIYVTASKTRAFWCARVFGESRDLYEWERTLSTKVDPFVERLPHDDELVLRSGEFDVLTTRLEVRERALDMIRNLNGAMRALCGTNQVRFGGVLEVFTDGTHEETIFGEAHQILPMFISGGLVTTGVAPIPPQPSNVQKWYALASTNLAVAEMLCHFGEEPTFYELFKVYEAIEV
jgi:hypothetical protein